MGIDSFLNSMSEQMVPPFKFIIHNQPILVVFSEIEESYLNSLTILVRINFLIQRIKSN